jgi:glutamate-ammonia-ligase adenylyltransferase
MRRLRNLLVCTLIRRDWRPGQPERGGDAMTRFADFAIQQHMAELP